MLKNLMQYVNKDTIKSSKGFQSMITNIEKDEEPPKKITLNKILKNIFLSKKEDFQHINIYNTKYCIMILPKNSIQRIYIIRLRGVIMNTIMDTLKVFAVMLIQEIV